MSTFISQVNGNDLYAKRAERTRSGLNLETFNDGTNDVPGILPAGVGTSGNAVLATQQYVLDSIGGVAGAMVFKDVVNGSTKVLPTTGYKAGWTYEVAVAGTYAGQTCEVGDMIICVKNFDTTASDSDWAVIQKNLDGAVIGPASSVTTNIAVFDGTSGKLLKDGGAKIVETVSGESTNAQVPTAAAVHTAIGNAIGDLDVSDLVQDTEGSMAGKTLLTLSETDGEITATFQDIKIESSQIKDKMSTYDGTGTDKTKVVTGEAVKAALDTLDVSDISGFGADKTLATLTETDGKIAATFQDIAINGGKVTVTSGVENHFVGIDANGKLKDSGKAAADFATAAQGLTADSAIQGVKLSGATDPLTPDSSKVVTIPDAVATGTGETNGLMTAADKAKLNGISTGANKVESSTTNGNIKIDGNETTVYTHPTTTAVAAAAVKVGNDANGHVVLGAALAKGDVGLDNVDNTSDATKKTNFTGSIADGDTGFVTGDAVYDALALKAPLASPALTGTPTAPTAAEGTNTTQIATTAFVKTAVEQGLATADALVYKGTVAGGDTAPYGALTPAANKGYVYKVTTAGKIDGVSVEVGDMLICNTDDTAAATADNYETVAAKWDFIQTNLDGAVIGPVTSTDGHIALFDGATGNLLKDGIDPATLKTKQTAYTATGLGALKTITALTQNANGEISVTAGDIQSATTAQAGVVQLAGSIGGTVANENNKAASEKAVRDAINDLDVSDLVGQTEQISKKGKTLLTLSEADGKISATFQDIEITTSQISDLSTALGAKADKVSGAVSGNFAGLDENGNLTDSGSKASDFKTKQTAVSDPTVPSTGTTDSLSFIDTISQDTNGVITATKKKVKVADTYSDTGADPVNGKAVKAALATLDAEVTSSDGTNVQVKVTEVDGKITAVNITDSTASSTHVHGNLSNDGKVGTTADRAIVTGTGGAIEAADLTTADPTATGTSTSGIAYINSVSQLSKGQISATKTYVPVAASNAYGVVTVSTITL